MRIFKNYFKLLKSNMGTVVIYVVIFAAIAVLMGLNNRDNSNSAFEVSKASTVFVNNDSDSALIDSMYDYLGRYCEWDEHETDYDTDTLKDSVFFMEVTYVLIVPENFTADFESGKDVTLERMTSSNAEKSDYINLAINNYLSTARTFLDLYPDADESTIIDLINDSLSSDVSVEMTSAAEETGTFSFLATYFNFFVYILIAIFVSVMCTITTAYNRIDMSRRNAIAPIPTRKLQTQLFLGHVVFALFSVVILTVIGFLLNGSGIFNTQSLMFIINILIFALCCTSIAFLLSQISSSTQVIIIASNVLSLGLSFISGAFVPQELLSDGLLTVSKFTPAYWFVYANDSIASATTITNSFTKSYITCIVIELAFTIAFFAIALAVSKSRRRREV